MRKYNINAIENLHDKAQRAVLFNGSTGEWFRTTVGVRQGCLLSPTLLNIFLETIMCEALDDHEGSVSIGGRHYQLPLCRWHYRKCRREKRSWRPGRPSRYSHHKVQIGDRPREDKSDDKQPKWLPKRDQDKRSERTSSTLEQSSPTKDHFNYLGAIISNAGSKPEILSRIAQTTAALSRLKIIWRNKNISLASKVKLMRTLILSTFLYACESWTLTAEFERRIQSLEMRCYRGLLDISYKDHVTNEEVRNRIQNAVGVQDDLLTMVKKRKLRWYGHISTSPGMAKTILQGTVKEEKDRRRDGKITSRNGREWGFEIPWGPQKTGNRLPAKNDPAPPLGNFADIVYLKEQSFLHRIRDVCTL